MFVDAEVVPVEHVEQVIQAQPPGRVLGLVAGAGGESTLTLESEDLHPFSAGVLQSERLAGRRRRAVPGRAGIELEEEGLAGHLCMARQSAVTPQSQQVLRHECKPLGVGHLIARVTGLLELHSQQLVEDGQGNVEDRIGVAGHQNGAIPEALSPDGGCPSA